MFEHLSKELNLKKDYQSELQLSQLQSWVEQNINPDLEFEGSPAERYAQYYSMASNYLDNFLSKIPEHLAEIKPEYDNLSALQYAAKQGYAQFISHYAPFPAELLNTQDKFGMTALHYAAIEGQVAAINALLSQGASPKIANIRKQLPIHSALFVPILHDKQYRTRKEEIFKCLLDYAPDTLNSQDIDGNTLMHLAAEKGFDALITSLLEKNLKLVFLENYQGLAPIHSAILNQQEQAVAKLLEVGDVAQIKGKNNRLPLHYAARYGNEKIMNDVCKATVNLNAQDDERRTAVLWAVVAENQPTLKVLMANGADHTIPDHTGKTPLDYAREYGSIAIEECLLASSKKC